MSVPTPGIDYVALKSGGIIMQKDDDFFALRLRLPGGSLPADLLPKIAEVAKRYGRGEVRLTARQGIEIPGIKFAEIEAARKDLANVGLALGPCGPRFRTVTACPGLPVCRRALADSQSFALQIDRKFAGLLLPHKFKATVSACPNACSRPLENEIGFCGTAEPQLYADDCMGCGLCVDICKENALVLQDGKPLLDRNRCTLCSDCIQSCPTDAWKTKKKGYAVYAGGKNGRHPAQGEKIADFVDEEQGMMIIQRCLDYYRLHGNKRERLGDLIRRVGMDEFRAAVLQ
ncbi:MAG: 4Fe-4S binding protein [Methanothrix sp.]|jgi:dissimilatory sulfite reductase (desulfoviridin) alpha/beta subunit|nr:4Fe-4S binding protein [Methanothrix sp.]